ncbi:hypothetical protein [Streptomyces sp. NBC_01422]|uniref:hypothetical protein n=1 Tax=Streptomyces sp. NBC_01422 TaxID=2903859 RepID=UPI002E28B118|nr:hypothetical protein [Streptomyces sp. NBC_01422]
MAIQPLMPYPVPADMMQIEDVRDQLNQTGHPVPLSRIREWIVEQDLYTERSRRRVFVSFSDILMAHQEYVTSKN